MPVNKPNPIDCHSEKQNCTGQASGWGELAMLAMMVGELGAPPCPKGNPQHPENYHRMKTNLHPYQASVRMYKYSNRIHNCTPPQLSESSLVSRNERPTKLRHDFNQFGTIFG